MTVELCAAAEELGVTREQLLEVIERIRRIREDGGFGNVMVNVRSGMVYKIDHTVHGKPMVFGRHERE